MASLYTYAGDGGNMFARRRLERAQTAALRAGTLADCWRRCDSVRCELLRRSAAFLDSHRGDLFTRLGAFAAHLRALLHHLVAVADALAVVGAIVADLRASPTGSTVERRLPMQEAMGQPADRGAIGQQRLMLARSVFAAQVEAVNDRSQAGVLTLMANSRAL